MNEQTNDARKIEIGAQELIQMRYYDRLTLDECAAVYGVDRATIAQALDTFRRLAPLFFPEHFKKIKEARKR